MATSPKSTQSAKNSSANSARIWLYSLLLTLQYGLQPLISRWFIRREVIVTTSVLTCEVAKVIFAVFFYGKRRYSEETLPAVDFGRFSDSIRTSCCYLRTAE
ncbi:hypothetical protein NL676_019782 [Syzygium grande]|nr:hypothetical protein NL676_019782 [Syzygium grande]